MSLPLIKNRAVVITLIIETLVADKKSTMLKIINRNKRLLLLLTAAVTQFVSMQQ